MRRDYFTLELRNVEDDADEQPTVHVTFDGPTDVFEERLTADTDVDVAFRYQSAVDDADPSGVLSVTEQVTGEFILEVNADPETVQTLIDAAQNYGQTVQDADGCYSIVIQDDDDRTYTSEKRTLLVYDHDGSLLRQRSLIPSGVEL